MRKVLHARWISQNDPKYPLIGIVAAVTDEHLPEDERTWCAYAGTGKGNLIDYTHSEISITEKIDQQFICNNGGKLLPNEAAGFFPQLDITKYKRT